MERSTHEIMQEINSSNDEYKRLEIYKCSEALHNPGSSRAYLAEKRFGPEWKTTVRERLDYLLNNEYSSGDSLPGDDYVPTDIKKKCKNKDWFKEKFDIIFELGRLW